MLFIADIMLAIGAKTENKTLLVPWLVLYMIFIIVVCLLAPFLIYMAAYAVDELRSHSWRDHMTNETYQTINNHLPSQDRRDIEEDTKEFIGNIENSFDNIDTIMEENQRDIFLAAVSVLIPIFYLYTWTATLSLFKMLNSQPQHSSHRQHGHPQYPHQPLAGLRRPHPKLVAIGMIRNAANNQVHPHSYYSQQSGGYYPPSPGQPGPWYVNSSGSGSSSSSSGQHQQLPTIYVQEPGDMRNSRY